MNSNVSMMEKLRWRIKALEHKFQQYRLTTNETAEAETEYGKIKGIKRMTVYDQSYYSFEGIPYAQPPVGELRFKAPKPPVAWEGVKDCTHHKDKAVQVQFIFNKVEGTEDCLYLNVYTRNLKPEKPQPVLIWIHGGGFVFGEANRDWHGPDYFMQKDVVLVTIQYRLGVLGFLSLNSESLDVPGNAGLKDQVLAIKWVKNNIAHFGGDPECITVFGESAGGASTSYMTLTEQTKGLFHRAIMMSGNAFAQWSMTDCQKRAYTLAKLVGYKGEDNEQEVLEFLMKAKAKDLIRKEEEVLTLEERKNRVMFAFSPTIEPYKTADCVVPKHPKEMIKTAWGNSIPTLTGNTSMEGLLFLPETKLVPSVLQDLETCIPFVPHDLRGGEADGATLVENGSKIKKAHLPDEQQPSAEAYLDLCSTMHFWFPLHRMLQARLHHAGDAAPVYMYRFDFDSEVLIYPYRIMRWGRGVKGVSHADELSYLFWSLLAHRLPKESREYRTIERMIGIWTKFATDGNPIDADIDGMKDLNWQPIKKADEVYKCLNIGDDLKFIDLPEMEKIKHWASMYDNCKDKFF